MDMNKNDSVEYNPRVFSRVHKQIVQILHKKNYSVKLFSKTTQPIHISKQVRENEDRPPEGPVRGNPIFTPFSLVFYRNCYLSAPDSIESGLTRRADRLSLN